jgi:hypothetical protein
MWPSWLPARSRALRSSEHSRCHTGNMPTQQFESMLPRSAYVVGNKDLEFVWCKCAMQQEIRTSGECDSFFFKGQAGNCSGSKLFVGKLYRTGLGSDLKTNTACPSAYMKWHRQIGPSSTTRFQSHSPPWPVR